MGSNLDRYKKDLDALIAKGDQLSFALQYEHFPERVKELVKGQYKEEETEAILKALPSFQDGYQAWYSEAKVLIKQVLPDRLADFVGHYERPKSRKELTVDGYRIEDMLQGLSATRYGAKVVGPEHAIPHFQQQIAILKSVKARFESSLFNIRQLVKADLFDSELEAAQELAKHKFIRAAGALAGVVLERHLLQVCENHAIKITKKAPGISDLNQALRDAGVIDIPQWRFVQHLADIRNLCDHSKESEPTSEQVNDLISGVAKVIKTVF